MPTRIQHFLIACLLAALSACGSENHYPFPPQFVGPNDVSPRVLAVPAAAYSEAYTQEIDGILARQATLTADEKAAIRAEDHISPAMILDPVLGNTYTAETNPAMFLLLKHAASDAWRDADFAQDYWKRQRPWVMDSRVQLLVNTIKRPSYPSGHSTTNHVWANVLSDLFPEHQEAFFTRAYEIGTHRTWAGVHYPSDIEAGKKFAAFLYEKMAAHPQYKEELAAARAELTKNASMKIAPGSHAGDAVLPQGSAPGTPCPHLRAGASFVPCQ